MSSASDAALEEATDTRDVNIEAGALASVPDVFGESFGEGPAVIVADGNTFEVAGKEVQRRLEEAGYTMMEPYVFPGRAAALRRVLEHREAQWTPCESTTRSPSP